jgi:nitrous oxidase accessory protein NosD
MEFFLRPGDLLLAEPLARGRSEVRIGDIALFMGGKDAPILAHRVLWTLGALWTKGDFHIVPEKVPSAASLVGRVVEIHRDGKRLRLDTASMRGAGLLLAAYSLFGAFLYRLAQAAGWSMGRLFEIVPDLRRCAGSFARARIFLETFHLYPLRSILRRIPEALCPFAELPDAGAADMRREATAIRSSLGPRWVGGELRGDVHWRGEVRVFGDVVVLPGASLTIHPGANIVFLPGKRFHHGVRRVWEGRVRPLTDSARSHLVIYGRLRVLGRREELVRLRAESSSSWGGVLILGGAGHEVRGASFEGSVRGVLCLEDADADVSDTVFLGMPEPAFAAADRVQGRLRRCRFQESGPVLVSGSADLRLEQCEWERCGSGLLAKGEGRVRLLFCGMRTGKEALRLEERACLESSGCSIQGFSAAAVLIGDSFADVSSCSLLDNGTGVKLEGRSRFLAQGLRAEQSAGHGLWACGESEARLRDSEWRRGRENGVYASGSSRVVLEKALFEDNPCGLSCEEDAHVHAASAEFRGQGGVHVRVAGGEHLLESCSFSGGRLGVDVSGSARAAFKSCRAEGSEGQGFLISGQAACSLEDVRAQGNGIGVRIEGASRVRARALVCEGNLRSNGSICGGEHVLEDCSFSKGHAGLDVSGDSRLTLKSVLAEGNAEQGLIIGGDAACVLEGVRAQGNGIGVRIEGASRVRARALVCEGNLRSNGSICGGEHVLEDCSFSKGHVGLDVSGDSRLTLESVRAEGNAEQGLIIGGDVACVLEGVRAQGNGIGVRIEGASRVRARALVCEGNLRSNGSVCGGEHVLEDCSFSKGHVGLDVSGDSRLTLKSVRAEGNAEQGMLLSGRVSCSVEDVSVCGGGTGMRLEGAARLTGRSLRAAGNTGHGLWLSGESCAELRDCEWSKNLANGIYFDDLSRLAVRSSIISSNACGVTAEGTPRSSMEGVLFSGEEEAHARWMGGEHSLRDCGFSGGRVGVDAPDAACFELRRCRVQGCSEEGVRVGGRTWFGLYETVLQDCGTGLRAGGDSCSDAGGLSCTGNLRAGASFSGGEHSLRESVFERCGAGLEASGAARLTLSGCRARGCAGPGFFIGERAALRVEGACAQENGSGFHSEGEARLIGRGLRSQDNLGHGLWAAGSSRVSLRGSSWTGNRADGIYAVERSFLELEDSLLKDNLCGLGAQGSAQIRAQDVHFSGAADAHVRMSGAEARLSRCSFSGGRIGADACGDARLALEDCLVEGGSEQGLRAAGRARCSLRSVRVEGCGVGLRLEDESCARVRGSSFLSSASAGVSAGGGRHLFEDSVFLDGLAGVEACGDARLELASCRVEGNSGQGLFFGERSECSLDRVSSRRNGTGLRLEQDSRAHGRGFCAEENSRHGVWAADRARADLSDAVFTGNRDNGVYLLGQARLELRRALFKGNGCGFSCGEESRVSSSDARVLSSVRAGLSLSGGRHRFSGGETADSPEGTVLSGNACAEFSDTRMSGHAAALLLFGDSRAVLEGCSVSGNETGLWAQERSGARVRGGAFTRQSRCGLRLTQQGFVECLGARLRGNDIAVLLEDGARAGIERCCFSCGPTGIKADGASKLELSASRFHGCSLDGVWLSRQAQARLSGNRFTAGRIGVHRHPESGLQLGDEQFLENILGDVLVYEARREVCA